MHKGTCAGFMFSFCLYYFATVLVWFRCTCLQWASWTAFPLGEKRVGCCNQCECLHIRNCRRNIVPGCVGQQLDLRSLFGFCVLELRCMAREIRFILSLLPLNRNKQICCATTCCKVRVTMAVVCRQRFTPTSIINDFAAF